jgi:hypothetical protein
MHVLRSSVRACSSPLLPRPVKANVLFFTMVVKTFRSKMYTRAGVAADGERGVIGRPVKWAQTFPGRRVCFSSPIVSFARVIFLTGAASNQLHTAGNNVWSGVFDQKMDMVGGDHVIQHRKTEALFGLEYPAQGISFD